MGVPSADLDDLMQEVFLVAHRRRDSYAPDARLSTWLFGIALRVAQRHRRRPWFWRERAARPADAEPQHSLTPERALEHDERQRELERALSTLRPERSAVFVMSELEDIPLRDIAVRMGTPLGTVCSRLHAARKDLQRALHRAGSAALIAVFALYAFAGVNRPGV